MTTETPGGVDGVVMITVDSLRADVLSGEGDATTAPTLTDLADDAATFSNAVAHGNWTPFSFPSLLAGQRAFADSDGLGLTDDPTLAETLREAGVATAGFNDANGFLTSHWGYDRGFDEFDAGMTTDGGPLADWLAAHPTVQGWWDLAKRPARRLVRRVGAGSTDHREAPSVERRATAFLDDVEPPFFLWLHYMDAHTPYVPAPRHVRAVSDDGVGMLRALRAQIHTGLGRPVDDATLERLWTLYRACVRQVDESVGRVLEALSGAGLREDTAVVFAGDHGEEFLEHGHLAHYPKLYRELVEVPLFVDHPEAGGRTVETPVGLSAVPRTVCDLLDVEPPGTMAGRSRLGAAFAGTAPAEEPVTSVAVRGDSVTQQPIPRRLDDGETLLSARTADWTYVYHTESGRRELYDRRTDPEERENVVDRHREGPVVRRLHAAVERRRRRLGGDDEREEPPEAVSQRLSTLGYR